MMRIEVREAEDDKHASTAARALDAEPRPKRPEGPPTRSPTTSRCSFASPTTPAEHWLHPKTSNPISVDRPAGAGLSAAA